MRRGLAGLDAPDYADMRRRINAAAVLEHYDAANTNEQANHDGTTEIVHSCLLDRVEPHHANGDANPSASCNTDKGTYVCYSYSDPDPDPRYHGHNGMDMLRLIMKMERKRTIEEAADVINRFLDGTTQEASAFTDQLTRLFVDSPRGPGGPRHQAYSRRILEPWAFTHPYLQERGVDLQTASLLQIGYDKRTNRITIPHFWSGDLVGYQQRAIPGADRQHPDRFWPATEPAIPKYKSSPGFPKSTTLYGRDRVVGSEVVVVESPFSVIKAVALGVSRPVVATFGAKISDAQIAILREFSAVTVWMDHDEAGQSAQGKLIEALRRHVTLDVVVPDFCMDLGDYDTAESVQAKLDAAVPAYIIAADKAQEEKWAQRRSASAR